MKVILASASPRRRELLEGLGIKNLSVMPSRYESPPPEGASPEQAVKYIAMGKAMDIAKSVNDPSALIIAADTLVYLDGVPMGKPKNREDAKKHLSALSGREHIVASGVAIIYKDKSAAAGELTHVRFAPMSEREIDWYISTGEPMDKAGSYGIQGLGSIFIEGIRGDYFNVMGLPVHRLSTELNKLGISILDLICSQGE